MKMKLPDCASNIDVKNVRVCPNRIILRGVMAFSRGGEGEKIVLKFIDGNYK